MSVWMLSINIWPMLLLGFFGLIVIGILLAVLVYYFVRKPDN
jgi:hypothetical protein